MVGGAWLCGCYHDTQMTITLKPHSTLITLSDTFLALNKHWVFFIQDSFFLPAISIQLIQCHLMMEYGMSSFSIFRCESISLTDLVPSALHLHSFSTPRILDLLIFALFTAQILLSTNTYTVLTKFGIIIWKVHTILLSTE